MDSDDLMHLYAEVVNGVPEEKSSLPKTEEVAAQRARLIDQVKALRSENPDTPFDIQFEWADIQTPATGRSS